MANLTAYGSTIYLTPYTGSRVGLYDGVSAWTVLSTAEISIDISSLSSGVYDLFLYNNDGVPTLEVGPIWTDTHTRDTAIVLQDGVYSKDGDVTRRYMGTFWTDGTATYDLYWSRSLFNAQNRLPASLGVNGPGGGTFSTNSNGWSVIMSCNFVIGVAAESIVAFGTALGQGDGVSAAAEMGLGFNTNPPLSYSGVYAGIAAIVGTSALSINAIWAPLTSAGPSLGYQELDLFLRSTVDTTTINLLDDGLGNNLTYLTGIVWV